MAQFKADAHRVSAVSLAELYALQSLIFAFQVEHTKTGDVGREAAYANLGHKSSQSF